MTFGTERTRRTRVGQALSYAGIGPEEDPVDVRVRKRAEITARWLPEIVDEVLASDEIAHGIAQTGLDPRVLRQEVLDHRPEILAPADAELEDAIDAVLQAPAGTDLRPMELRPDPGGFAVIAIGLTFVIGPLALLGVFWTDLPIWLALLLVLPVVAVAILGSAVVSAG